MSDTNRVRVVWGRETTLGVTPGSPRSRTVRLTGEDVKEQNRFDNSAEIRSDRMSADPVRVGVSVSGSVKTEFSYPFPGSPASDFIASAFFSEWSDTPARDNDGTADSAITNMAATTDVATVLTGSAFVTGQLVRFTGFSNSANNGVFKCTTGSATVPAFVGAGFVTEAAPPAAARMKVVGFKGASGDITATATGLGSTSLNFTTLGLSVGKWVKIGGTAAGDKFATAACNGWARVTAIAANALTLDNRPSGWTTDSGTSKTVSVWFGDHVANGTTRISGFLEKAFLDQASPTYVLYNGNVVNTADFTLESGKMITADYGFTGLTATVSASEVDSPDAATTSAVMSAAVNVGNISEAGSAATANPVKKLVIKINNNLRALEAIRSDGSVGAIDIGVGECAVSGSVETYFSDSSLLAKLRGGTATSLSARTAKNSQAVVIDVPRVTLTDGSPNAGQKNSDVMFAPSFVASMDSTTSAHIIINRLEYYE